MLFWTFDWFTKYDTFGLKFRQLEVWDGMKMGCIPALSWVKYKHTLLVSNRTFPIEGKCNNHSNQDYSCCYSCIYKALSNKKVQLLSFNCFKKQIKINCIIVRQQVKWKCMTEWSSLWQNDSFFNFPSK